jgi:hypothetical protein
MVDNKFKRSAFVVSSFLLLIMTPHIEAKSVIENDSVPEPPYICFAVKAITNDKILPWSLPTPGQVGNVLRITACRGEYQPASFCVHARKNIADLRLAATELKAEDAVIPAKSVDIRVVKCWYQAGEEDVYVTKERRLVPELLLKDENLIRVDFENKQNYLREFDESGKEREVLISGPNSDNMKHIQPRDAKELQPVNIQAGETRQFWVTLHVPEDANPGNYKGQIHLTAAGLPSTALILHLRVLPFALEKPQLEYSIYYRGILTEDGKGSISSEKKSAEQYEAEMRNIKDHGIDYPTTYQPYNEKLLEQMFEIRDRVGLPRGPLYTLGLLTGNPQTLFELDALKRNVNKWLKFAKKHRYSQVYVYGMDEVTGDRLKSQRGAWQAVHDAGGKIFVACFKGAFESMGDLLDLAILSGPPIPDETEKYHRKNHKIFCYNNPQVGAVMPETYRRNFGILLWKNGYDGAMDYAYQHSSNHIWNDFDHPKYRDHVFAFPTINGVIDTVQWEGFREGVNDVRYCTTLLRTVEKALAHKPKIAREAKKWFAQMDAASDLDKLRQAMIAWILTLQ